MGNVVFINKEKEGLIKYLDSATNVSGLKNGVDFEIVSFVFFADNFQAYSLGGFLGTRSNDLFKEENGKYINTAKRLVKGTKIKAIAATPYPTIDNVAFYEVKGQIDIDLATEIGLGVVSYKNKYMLYYPFLTADPISVVYEMLMLKVYFQLLYPEDVDVKFKSAFEKYADLIQSMMVVNGRKHIKRLKEIFANHK
jgi:hypothetical protein